MIKNVSSKKELEFVLDNLRNEDLREVKNLLKNDWKKKLLSNIDPFHTHILCILDKEGNFLPIAIGGFDEISSNPSIACCWLLTTKFVYKYKKLFFKEVFNFVLEEEKKYSLIYNFIYKSNYQAKSWLQKLGFKFDKANVEKFLYLKDFEFFYKIPNEE